MRVYLSGGMKSGWQNRVKNKIKDKRFVKVLDPAEHGLKEADAYTAWDTEGVATCDIVLAYLEKDNPGGIGLAYEVGAAVALGKIIILVDEKNDRYTQILRSAATVNATDLDNAIDFINAMALLL